MADIRTNIFGIGEVYELQREGQWVEKNRESFREYGYFGGGYNSRTFVHRIDYSNDTVLASVRSPLPTSQDTGASFGNGSFGYFSQGRAGTAISRLNYSNETSSIRGPLSSASYRTAGCGNSNFGYTSGGQNGDVSTTIIQRTDFSNDLSTSVRRGSLLSVKRSHLSTGNSNFGYFAAGFQIGGNSGSIERSDYSNDTIRNISRTGMPETQRGFGLSNTNYAWFGGGYVTSISRMNFSNDTAATSLRAPLSSTRRDMGAAGNSNFGYSVGGGTGTPFPSVSITNRINYSNDTEAVSIRGPLPSNTTLLRGTSSASFGGSPVSYLGAPWTSTAPYGYFGGGAGSPDYSTVQRLDYSNDTKALSTRGPLSLGRREARGVGNSSFGYFCGGRTPIPVVSRVTTVDRIDYSNDSATASVRGPLSSTGYNGGATGNSNFGYIGGSNNNARVDRIQYSNDSVNVSVRGSLNRERSSATGNSNFGYFVGGGVPAAVSTIDRVDYSNDSVTASLRGLLSSNKFTSGAVGNSNFGYFAGHTGTSVIDRIDYSNDSVTASIRGNLSLLRYGIGSTGNSNFGYFGGGYNPSPATSILERIDYSNDTQTASVRGSLLYDGIFLGAASSQAYGGAPNTTVDPLPAYIRNATKWNDSNTLDLPFKRVLGSYGYFGGGWSYPTTYSSIDRIDYSNDTTTASVRGPLSSAKIALAATENSNFGYFGGGAPGSSPGILASVERIDYSNDIATVSVRGPLSSARVSLAATGNSNFGYFGGGNPGPVSTVQRIDYSNDIAAASIRGSLSAARQYLGAVGNSNFGYFGGGSPGPVSTVDRINFSNDTLIASVRGPLSETRIKFSGAGNNNFGYFEGVSFSARIQRIDYSNDTINASLRGTTHNSADGYPGDTGNSNFGYFGGGGFSGATQISRLDYSNDTANAPLRGSLTVRRGNLAATTNASNS